MDKYNNGKIYKLVSGDLIYIGSTTQDLTERLRHHLVNYKAYLEGKNDYITSFLILANDDYEIILIENYPTQTRSELLLREQYWIDNTNCVNVTRASKDPNWSINYRPIAYEAKRLYRTTEKGKAAAKAQREKYNNSEHGKAVNKAYYTSEIVKERKRKRYHEKKLLKMNNENV